MIVNLQHYRGVKKPLYAPTIVYNGMYSTCMRLLSTGKIKGYYRALGTLTSYDEKIHKVKVIFQLK